MLREDFGGGGEDFVSAVHGADINDELPINASSYLLTHPFPPACIGRISLTTAESGYSLLPSYNPSDMGFAVRRFVGIVSGICALYLTVGAVEAPCKDHSRYGASSSDVAPMATHNGSQHEMPAKKDASKPCKTVAIPCCVAMSSCGTTIVLGSNISSTVSPNAGQIVPSSYLVPFSRVAAPEPPPPKA